MDYNAIGQLIGTLGFPIVASCALFWMLNTTLKENTESNKEVRAALIELTAYMKKERENDA